MAANPISWRRVQQVNRRHGERFVHASTASGGSGEWWWWYCIRHDGSVRYYNPREDTFEEVEPDHTRTTTETLLIERSAKPWANEDWLRELDERAAQIAPGPDPLPLTG